MKKIKRISNTIEMLTVFFKNVFPLLYCKNNTDLDMASWTVSVLTSNCNRLQLSVSIFVALSLIVVVSDLSAGDWFTNKFSFSDWSIVAVLLVADWLVSAKLASDWFNWEDRRCQLSRSTNGCVMCGSEKEEDYHILIYVCPRSGE